MCLINFQFQDHPNYKLIVAANRDEAYERPTAPAHFWDDLPHILAGRDLLQMGTWFGITKQGRIACLTNYREPSQITDGKISRGEIVKHYLETDSHPVKYLETIHEQNDKYQGFNVIVGNQDQLFYYNNIEKKIIEIDKGTHGVSNHMLDTPWPKVQKGKQQLRDYVMSEQYLDENKLFDILYDSEQAQDDQLPNTGVGIELERILSPLFIRTPHYGTRSSTILLIDKDDHVTFIERTYQNGKHKGDARFTFQI